jgi:hypothetical protein
MVLVVVLLLRLLWLTELRRIVRARHPTARWICCS